MYKYLKIAFILSLVAIVLNSCYDVEEGYRIDYPESSAQFTIVPVNYIRGKIGDTISFKIDVISESAIKSLTVSSSVSGGSGTGYTIPSGGNDPFIDHTYGTIQKNVKSIDIYYNYIVNQDSLNSILTFGMVDGEGKLTIEQEVITVPGIVKYNNVALYFNNSSKTDGFSSLDGKVYHYLPNYEPISEANLKVQEALDFVFIVENSSAMLVAPYDWHYSSSMQIRNKSKLKKATSISTDEFPLLTAAELSYVASNDTLKNGATYVSDIKVGDIIGFQTDFASANSYKYGLAMIKAIHPTNTEWYEGESYVIEMDVVTQK
ncbi:hypothetical protein [Roseimarinus sediminis]|uniref:hypothetical protein n=1 Tax=Roseimarinus sediminis TaxID=1610899 RepID=UPI003D20A0BD